MIKKFCCQDLSPLQMLDYLCIIGSVSMMDCVCSDELYLKLFSYVCLIFRSIYILQILTLVHHLGVNLMVVNLHLLEKKPR